MTTSNFKTFIIGTAEELKTSSKILLYNKSILEKLGYVVPISAYNLESIYSTILSEYKDYCYLLGENEGGKEEYIYKYQWILAKDNLPKGFDTIIYISSTDNRPIAYTIFFSVQGKDIDLDISVESETSDNTAETLEIINNLNPVQNIQSIQDTSIVGKGLDKHTTVQEYKEDTNNYRKGITYTSDVSGLSGGANIRLTDRAVKGKTLYKLGMNLISSDVDLINRFNRYSFGYYEGNLAVYVWNDGTDPESNANGKTNSFGIISLSEINKFGNNIIYTKSNTYQSDNRINSNSVKILYGAGKYLIVETKYGEIRLFDTRLKSFVPKSITGSKCYVDPLDMNSTVKILPEISTHDSILELVPELSGTFLDINGAHSSLELVRKIGSWFILRKKVLGNYIYVYSGISSAVWMTEEEYKNSIVVNDSSIIIDEGDYYLLCGSPNESEKTNNFLLLTEQNNMTTLDIKGCLIDCVVEEEEKDKLIEKLKYRVAPKTEELYNTFLNDFRKSPYPTQTTGLPKIIGACDGVIFYEEQQDLLNYL